MTARHADPRYMAGLRSASPGYSTATPGTSSCTRQAARVAVQSHAWRVQGFQSEAWSRCTAPPSLPAAV